MFLMGEKDLTQTKILARLVEWYALKVVCLQLVMEERYPSLAIPVRYSFLGGNLNLHQVSWLMSNCYMEPPILLKFIFSIFVYGRRRQSNHQIVESKLLKPRATSTSAPDQAMEVTVVL